MPKMNPELKVKWIEALRSGQYTQGQKYLKQTDALGENPRYCCLGVLCEVAGLEFIEQRNDEGTILFGFSNGEEVFQAGVIPVDCKSLFGFSGVGDYVISSLAHQNDDAGKSFLEIADIIERHF